MDESRPIFIQIAEQVENDIIEGALPEGSQIPSTNEFAAFLRVNPATALKGVNRLVDDGIVEKRRGIGMFVTAGARERLIERRRAEFATLYLRPLIVEAEKLGIDIDELAQLLRAGKDPVMTRTVVRARGLTKRYGSFTALDAVDLTIEEHRIYGLLGRNGAGKTTIMQLLTGQIFANGGELEVFGRTPAEHSDVLRRMCFIAESQRYPEDFTPAHVFRSAPWFFENWDAEYAERLVADFRLPVKRRVKKLSRGQLSAVGVIVGLASRAPLTFFDEPYLGLDAVARHIFYDRLLEDYAEHPRTVVLSTHLIDEVANLLEHVILIDQGRILLDRDADEVRGSATTVAGARRVVEEFVADRPVIGRESLGGLASVTIDGRLDRAERVRAAELGLELAPVSLQQLIVHLTGTDLAGSTEQEAAA